MGPCAVPDGYAMYTKYKKLVVSLRLANVTPKSTRNDDTATGRW